jgi:ferritin-like metal-binding protein YciE
MSDTVTEAREIYITGLRNQHAVEHQAIELLERQVGRLENYPDMAGRIRAHIEESRAQAARIERLLSGLDASASGMKDAMLGIAGNMAAMMHAPANDEVVKNTFANFAFEHFEIAAYKSLLTLAEMAAEGAAIAPLRESLREEEAMARWIDEHIAPTTRLFVSRRAAGETAGR